MMALQPDTRRPLRIAMTGSRGFLGREVVRQLAASDVQVVPLLREATDLQWKSHCESVDAIVHLAAPTSAVDAEAVDLVIAQTRRLFDALPSRRVSVVFAGSMALYRPPADAGPIEESSTMWHGADLDRQDLYTRMKSAQEGLVRSLCERDGRPLTIIRPTNVWDAERWQQSCIGPKAGPIWFVVRPLRRLRLTHVENCARAFVAALRTVPTNPVTEINVDDNVDISAWRYATRVVDRRRHAYLPLPLPGWSFDSVTAMAGAGLRRLFPKRTLPGLLSAERRRSRFGEFTVDTATARDLIDWAPHLEVYGAGR